MPPSALRVDGLGKKYKIMHETHNRYRTLRESMMSAAVSLGRWKVKRETSQEEFWALKDVSFEVQSGEVVGIIGRNGAGKSTLLKVLSRITKPTVGRVELNGRVGSLLEVGTGFHPELTGRENVYLNGSILGMTRREIDRKFDEIVAFAEIEKFLDTPVKRYSSGMYVRLAFAVAAHLEPEILIVDEVLAVGDAAFQKKCLERLRDCARVGRTVLLVSHQMNNVRDLCNRAIWLADGSLRMAGTAAAVVDRYLEEAACSIVPGDWIDLRGRTRTGNGQVRFQAARFYGRTPDVPPVSDGPLHCVLRLEADGSNPGGLGVEVQILDRFQNRLMRFNTSEARALRLPCGKSEICLTVDQLHLGPGSYAVNLFVAARDECDILTDAARIDVAPAERMLGNGWALDSLVTRKFTFTHQLIGTNAAEACDMRRSDVRFGEAGAARHVP